MISDLGTLNYLHDATVTDIRFTMTKDGNRRLVIKCICHDDAKYELWNGQPLDVVLDNVVLLEQKLYSFTDSREQISGWEFSLPAALEQEAEQLSRKRNNCKN